MNNLLNTQTFIFQQHKSEQAELSVSHGHLHHESENQTVLFKILLKYNILDMSD